MQPVRRKTLQKKGVGGKANVHPTTGLASPILFFGPNVQSTATKKKKKIPRSLLFIIEVRACSADAMARNRPCKTLNPLVQNAKEGKKEKLKNVVFQIICGNNTLVDSIFQLLQVY